MFWLLHLLTAKARGMVQRFADATFYDKMRFLRLALSGAIAGAAIISVVGFAFGYNDHETFDIAGAILGFIAVTLLKMSVA